MTIDQFYPIGTPGQPWTASETDAWLQARTRKRSYENEVLKALDGLGPEFLVRPYGALTFDPERYPLFSVATASPTAGAPWALITGGVHGYETSGVQGALAFLESAASKYRGRFNLLVVPCVSPWGYEVVNRWNPHAIDPNRSFTKNSSAQESVALMALLKDQNLSFLVHVDLHETTESDEDEFRPALAARDGLVYERGQIPDGFYTVGDTKNPQPEFQAAIIAAVRRVTHIAPPDSEGKIIGSPLTQAGVINYPVAELGLCAGITAAPYTTTTEVYPDSPRVSPQDCNLAQIAAVRAALDFALTHPPA